MSLFLGLGLVLGLFSTSACTSSAATEDDSSSTSANLGNSDEPTAKAGDACDPAQQDTCDHSTTGLECSYVLVEGWFTTDYEWNCALRGVKEGDSCDPHELNSCDISSTGLVCSPAADGSRCKNMGEPGTEAPQRPTMIGDSCDRSIEGACDDVPGENVQCETTQDGDICVSVSG